jgi:hypothetical protein
MVQASGASADNCGACAGGLVCAEPTLATVLLLLYYCSTTALLLLQITVALVLVVCALYIRQHTSAYGSIRQRRSSSKACGELLYI